MNALLALLAGLVFGAGLLLSGMSNPAKVQAFLDLAGRWDPSLAFVMAGAIAVGIPAFALAKRRGRTFLGLPVQLPARMGVTPRLVLGSAVFGIGWGLAGYCPGPAIVGLGAGYPKAAAFVAAMVVGMLVFRFFGRGGAGRGR